MLEHQNSLSPKKQGQFASKIRKLVNENHDIQTPKTDKVVRALDVRNEIANSKSIEQNGFIRPATAIRTRNIRVSNEAIYSNSDESSSELVSLCESSSCYFEKYFL